MSGHLSDGATPLNSILSGGDATQVEAYLSGMKKMVDSEAFLSLLNFQNGLGITALHEVCKGGYPDIVELLLDAGADPNIHAAGDKGCPPALFFAVAAAREQAKCEDIAPYERCIELLLEHPSFDVAAHDVDCGCHPIYVCLKGGEGKQDFLHDTLAILLSRGFNPNKELEEHHHLHRALQNGHLNCAKVLVLAGANLYATFHVPVDNKDFTFGEIAEILVDQEYSELLEQAYVATKAVSGYKWRRSILVQGNPTKLIDRTIATANQLVSFGRPLEARLLLRGILWMPRNAFNKKDRFKMLYLLVGFYFLAQYMGWMDFCGEKLLDEYPTNTMAKLHVACTMFHPYRGKPTERDIKWIQTVVAVAQHQLSNNSLSLEHGFFTTKDVCIRLKYIQQCLKEIEVQEHLLDINREADALKRAGHYDEAIAAYHTFHQRFPTFHPSHIVRAKGMVYRHQSKKLLKAFQNSSKEDLLVRAGQCGVDEADNYYARWRAIKEKLEMTLSEFDALVKNEDYQEGIGDAFTRIMVLFLLGRHNNLEEIVIESMKRILKARSNPDRTDCMNPSFIEDLGQEGQFTMNVMESAIVERAEITKLCFWEEIYAALKGNPHDLPKDSLALTPSHQDSPSDDLSSCSILSDACKAIIKNYCESGDLDERAVIAAASRAELSIGKDLDLLRAIYKKLGRLILEEVVLPAYSQGCSPRVVGTLLQGALDWDPHLIISKDLKAAHAMVSPPKRCGQCGICRPRSSCPCHRVYYCSRACQVKAWDKHKPVCLARTSKNKSGP